eukprot:2354123-Rhodomonas_salina.1
MGDGNNNSMNISSLTSQQNNSGDHGDNGSRGNVNKTDPSLLHQISSLQTDNQNLRDQVQKNDKENHELKEMVKNMK